MNDWKKIVENAPEALKPEAVPAPAEAGKPPLGHVERALNMQDRNMLIGAVTAYCQKDGHKQFKDHRKLDQVKRLLCFDETLDYFAMLDDSLEEARAKWDGAWSLYRLWRRWREGSVKTEDFRKDYPNVDLGVDLSKPLLRVPENSPEDKRGPERPFHLPAKLDSWIEDALRAMDWPTGMTTGAVEVCEKFGIKADE